MSWVTAIWSMVASACLTLAAMHVLVWSRHRASWANLAFGLAATGVAGIAAGELMMMRSATPEELGSTVRWTYLAVAVVVIALVGFVQASFGNGRKWLGWSAVSLQILALALNFATGANIIQRDITALRQMDFLGETISVAAAYTTNFWIHVDQLCALFLVLYVADATARLWRRGDPGERRRATRVGGSILGFILLATGYSALVDNQVIQSPYFISLPFLAIVLVMGLELSRDLLRSGQLVQELRTSESRLLTSRAELSDQLQFERMVTELSATLMHAPAAKVEEVIIAAMGRVADLLGFEIAVYSLLFGGGTGLVAYVWNKPGFPGMPSNLTEKDFPWKARELSAGRDTHIRTIDDFPPEASVDRATYLRYGIKSSFDVSIMMGGQPVGVFSLGSFRKEQSVPPQIIQRQRIVGDLFANAILRAESETALRESERRLDLAAEAANLGLWFWNTQENTMWATRRARDLFGFPPETALTYEMWLERLHPEDRPVIEAALAEARDHQGIYDTEYRIMRPDGEVRWIAARGEVATDPGSESTSMTGVVVDITERRRSEREIEQQRSELAHLSRVSTVSELSGSLAHELNQPLAIILTNAQAALRFLAQDPPDLSEARDILNDIVSEDQRAGQIIQKLRSLLKHGETSLRCLSVNDTIDEVLQLARSDLIEQGVTVRRNLSGVRPKVMADSIQLQQVLLNLVRNSCDAMTDNPVSGKHLTLATSHHDNQVRISVSDTGCGLPADLESVFESFYTTKEQGLGLGLSICRSIIRAHKGRLWAETPDGGGAVFCLELPAVETARAETG
ncbi:MAG: ATP-binding protein [Opitutaceae bacterium]